MSGSRLQFVCDFPGTLPRSDSTAQRAYLPDTRLVRGSAGNLEFHDSRAWVVSGRLCEPGELALVTLAHSRHVLDSKGGLLKVPVSVSESFMRDSRQAGLGAILSALFVYGTLMQGESRFKTLEYDCGLRTLDDGSISGRLIDLGTYPGLVQEGDRPSRVSGQLCVLRNPAHALELLDEIEDFLGWEESGSMYRRVVREVRLGDGSERRAWTYEYLLSATSHPEIKSGDWRSREL